MILHDLYTSLVTPEQSGKRIGLFRILCAIFGGLFVSYTGMTLMVFLIPLANSYGMIVSFIFTPFAWSWVAIWISLSPTKLQALLRSAIPTTLFSLAILLFYQR